MSMQIDHADYRSCPETSGYGTPAPRELTDTELEIIDFDFLDSHGMDLLLELRDAARLGTDKEFVLTWAAKLVNAEADALARK